MILLLAALCLAQPPDPDPKPAHAVDASTIRGKVLCGYQGWFRAEGDASGLGFVHWSSDPRRVSGQTLTVEMWPDLAEFADAETFPADGLTLPDGRAARLFSSDDLATVRRHFEWMERHGIDGAWLQQFAVDLPGGPLGGGKRGASRLRVLDHVRKAAEATGRGWAIAFDLTGMPPDRAFEVVSTEWRRLVEAGVTAGPRYLRERGRPAVEVFGYYPDRMTAEQAGRFEAFFHAEGATAAFLVGSGAWDWRTIDDPAWQAMLARLDAIKPWNVGNTARDRDGRTRASTGSWRGDLELCRSRGQLWYPVVYPGFGWDNLKKLPPGRSAIPRDGGRFYWDQFRQLADLGADAAFVAMFDEVDEATAIFKVSNAPPTQARFQTFEGLPTDWYLRLTGEAARRLRGREAASFPAEIPIAP